MRFLKITFSLLAITLLFSSCIITDFTDEYYEEALPADFVEAYDLWYVDYHATQGSDQIPFMQLAFTLSFSRGRMFANNNISGIGAQGGGYGIHIGDYSFERNLLVANHELDGIAAFEIRQFGENEIEMYHAPTNTSYYLIGYNRNEFDFDKLFYENIEYLLQDFEIWNKVETSIAGELNEFDTENFLKFTSEDNRKFYSSNSRIGTNIDSVIWNYEGGYEVFDVNGFENLKILTLGYDRINKETFELVVKSDNLVELFHIASGTTYTFEGDYFIQYLKDAKTKEKQTRKRTKIKRQKINKISY
ncbi:hypothetical protein [Flavicella marina]|uniref:hypothetical protein n=1 Tax=Flavicella marina TaxID=1475951 RepID=UPI0012647105|nr:hypothetical protein [Flavicella marina]